MKQIAIVTPIWRNFLETDEILRLRHSLGNNSVFDHFFVGPGNLNYKKIIKLFPKSEVVTFAPNYFKSIGSYNNFMLSPKLYKYFDSFEYLLICQTDAILLQDISPILKLNYDYIGAPWDGCFEVVKFTNRLYANSRVCRLLPHTKVYIGNGGLSLRKVSSFLNLFNNTNFKNYLKSRNSKKRQPLTRTWCLVIF